MHEKITSEERLQLALYHAKADAADARADAAKAAFTAYARELAAAYNLDLNVDGIDLESGVIKRAPRKPEPVAEPPAETVEPPAEPAAETPA